MKTGIRIFAFMSLMLCIKCQDFDEAFSNGTTDFAVNLLRNLAEPTVKNVLISPTSINVLLGLLQQGARNETEAQLAKVLNLKTQDSRNGFGSYLRSGLAEKSDESVTFKMGTKMYLRKGLEVKADFLKTAQDDFQTEVENLDVSSADATQIINNWVANATDGHIQDVVKPGALTSNSMMVLVSAVFFSGKWLKPFKTAGDDYKFFIRKGTEIKIPMFEESRRLVANHEKDLKFKWIELPYQGGKYSMYLVLPTNRFKTYALLKKFNGDILRKMIDTNSTKYVNLLMPKLSLQMSTSLEKPLSALGLTSLLSESPDLSGISDSIKVTEIMHDTALTVSENGTEAAAATGVVINMLSFSWSPDEMDFFVNQPFLAFIVDKIAKVPIFAAKIGDPRG